MHSYYTKPYFHPAGMARMKLPVFTLFTVAGSLIWDTVLVTLGAVAGESWNIITEYLDTYSDTGLDRDWDISR